MHPTKPHEPIVVEPVAAAATAASRPAATTKRRRGPRIARSAICKPARFRGVTPWRSKKRPRLYPSGRNEGGRDEGRRSAGCSARALRLWLAPCRLFAGPMRPNGRLHPTSLSVVLYGNRKVAPTPSSLSVLRQKQGCDPTQGIEVAYRGWWPTAATSLVNAWGVEGLTAAAHDPCPFNSQRSTNQRSGWMGDPRLP